MTSEWDPARNPIPHPAVGWGIILIRWIGYLASLVFLVIADDEWTYAGNHPHAYGPAKYIAAASLAGVAVSVALVLVTTELARLVANQAEQSRAAGESETTAKPKQGRLLGFLKSHGTLVLFVIALILLWILSANNPIPLDPGR